MYMCAGVCVDHTDMSEKFVGIIGRALRSHQNCSNPRLPFFHAYLYLLTRFASTFWISFCAPRRSCVAHSAHFVFVREPEKRSHALLTSSSVSCPYFKWTLNDPGACRAYFIDIAVVIPSPINSVMRVARPLSGRSCLISGLTLSPMASKCLKKWRLAHHVVVHRMLVEVPVLRTLT